MAKKKKRTLASVNIHRHSQSSKRKRLARRGGATLIPTELIERRVLLIRAQKVLLDFQLAELYGVETKVLNQAVRRNIGRFPSDFMFPLTVEESETVLRSQIVTSNSVQPASLGAGGRRYCPLAFTEHGVAMLSSVLRSAAAVQVNIAIMRTFGRLRQLIATHSDLAQKLARLEERYDEQFKVVFDAIHELMNPPEPEPAPEAAGELGFHTLMARSAGQSQAKRLP